MGIHACKNDCIMFCGDYKDLTKCPELELLDSIEETTGVMRKGDMELLRRSCGIFQ